MTKAIFFDIDGTILDAVGGIYNIRPNVRNAIKKLQATGNLIFIATGRPYAFLQREILNFGFDGFIMCNGAVVLIGDKIIYQHTLEKSDVKKIISMAISSNLEYMLEDYPLTYTKKDFQACHEFFGRASADMNKISYDFDLDKIAVSKIECTTNSPDPETTYKAYKEILNLPGFTGWADPFHFKMLEVYAKDISKATGIEKVLEHFNIPVENSYAFGDGRNDFEMMKAVGCGMAMGTGSDDFKRTAKYVVPSVFDDGVAYGIEKYILGAD